MPRWPFVDEAARKRSTQRRVRGCESDNEMTRCDSMAFHKALIHGTCGIVQRPTSSLLYSGSPSPSLIHPDTRSDDSISKAQSINLEGSCPRSWLGWHIQDRSSTTLTSSRFKF